MIDPSLLNDGDIRGLVARAEAAAEHETRLNILFRDIPLEVYGLLQFVGRPAGRLGELLPRTPTEAEQIKWTGTHGAQMVTVASSYIKSMLVHASFLSGKPATEMMFLDHGCGWGRIPRFLSRFLAAEQICGFDPMAESIAICQRDKVPGTFRQCDPYPESLPADAGQTFDLINVFSVFTHLNEAYQFKVLEALRDYIAPKGVLAATIRRDTFWNAPRFDAATRETMIRQHRTAGFAHLVGGNLGTRDKSAFFGETSTSIDYVRDRWKGWTLVATDISAAQPGQIVLFLQPA
ncbi:class I SAM-dependent methyltransferase [Rhodobacter capsulatus]|uniref:Methyltransferase domain-containing protein n=1 Tax=Rhodobacter capsulatus TaxID=1061 RepID=A0A1G7CV98_RHOCA|nr:class I SAM-dependent methyltransferase [Rhodobacter capsulatus]WER10800.1 class I SAM-dependent methyltransferase [Rhodobacter capsulatus]SDE43237.1 Methyltransferase domain-containing protein [Rhodobacter capsulatus]